MVNKFADKVSPVCLSSGHLRMKLRFERDYNRQACSHGEGSLQRSRGNSSKVSPRSERLLDSFTSNEVCFTLDLGL